MIKQSTVRNLKVLTQKKIGKMTRHRSKTQTQTTRPHRTNPRDNAVEENGAHPSKTTGSIAAEVQKKLRL